MDWESGQIRVNYNANVYFTDGSVKNDVSGYGALFARDHSIIMGQCGKHANITQAEIAAIHGCCIHALDIGLTGPIYFYSDSVGALNALKRSTIESGLVLECVRLLEQLSQSCDIKLVWLPAHSNIYGNETADKIAKYAADQQTVGPEPLMAINRQTIKKTNKLWLQENTMLAWRGANGCEHTKRFVATTTERVSNQLIEMSKSDIRITTGIITGHCRLNQHLMRLGIRNDPDCDLCGRTSETGAHFLCECSALINQRKRHFSKTLTTPSEVCKGNLLNIVRFYKECSETYNHILRAFG